MGILIHQVDAFTDRPFTGNPAAVCLLPREADPGWMQAVAAEMNLAETAFVWKEAGALGLRWFTPTVEVDLCGHATLAAAHVLWDLGRLGREEAARFHTRSGLLTATLTASWIALDFPAHPAEQVAAPPALAALGAEPVFVGRSRFDLLVELRSEQEVRALKPDVRSLATLPVRGVIVTAAADAAGVDYVLRFFAPQTGVDEDPVTGSAQCTLAPHWAARIGRHDLVGRQVSARGGTLRVRLDGDRVSIAGQAVTVLRGELAGFDS
jgi:PhzF family phenazine biosynthesis protein